MEQIILFQKYQKGAITWAPKQGKIPSLLTSLTLHFAFLFLYLFVCLCLFVCLFSMGLYA